MVGWYHWFSGHELGQTPGDGEGQGSPSMLQSVGSQSWTQLGNWTTQQKMLYNIFILQICMDNVSEVRMGI